MPYEANCAAAGPEQADADAGRSQQGIACRSSDGVASRPGWKIRPVIMFGQETSGLPHRYSIQVEIV